MLSHGGIKGVRETLVTDALEKPQQEMTVRWERISSFNNFLYQEDCVTVWKAYNIGQGKSIPWSQLQDQHHTEQNISTAPECHP